MSCLRQRRFDCTWSGAVRTGDCGVGGWVADTVGDRAVRAVARKFCVRNHPQRTSLRVRAHALVEQTNTYLVVQQNGQLVKLKVN